MGCGVSRIREGASEGTATGNSVDGERPGPARWCGRVRRNQESGRKGRRAGLDAGFFRRPASYRSPSSAPPESSGNVGEKKSGIDWREDDEVLQQIRPRRLKIPARKFQAIARDHLPTLRQRANRKNARFFPVGSSIALISGRRSHGADSSCSLRN